MNSDDLIRPHWNCGQMIAFSALDGDTDYGSGLVARTAMEPPGIKINDPGGARLEFLSVPVENVWFGGDCFSFTGSDGMIRGALIDAYHLLIEGACAVANVGDDLSVCEERGRLLVGVRSHFDKTLIHTDMEALLAKRSRWILEREIPNELVSSSKRTLARALTMMKSQVYSPEGVLKHHWTTPDRWPHKDMWLWDTAFHAIGWRHVDPQLAMEMIEGMFDLQREDGFLTYRGNPQGPYFHLGGVVTQPPVLANATSLVHETSGDDTWLKRLYPKLAAYVEWDLQNRDVDGGGLMEWFIEDDETCRSGESGMDNSPRFDRAVRLDAVDFNALLARECEVLATMAGRVGLRDEAVAWSDRHAGLCQLINEKCWSEEDGFYFDFDPATGRQSPIWSSAGFLPLFCGAPDAKQAGRMLAHLNDSERFATRVPVPSVAVCDRDNYSKDMWRGPMWVNVNWLIGAGLKRYGLHEASERLRKSTLGEIERTCEKFGTFFEYFDDRQEVEPPDLLRKGENAPKQNPYRQVIHEFGWTATLYADWILRKPTN